jgi:hypothetical protein
MKCFPYYKLFIICADLLRIWNVFSALYQLDGLNLFLEIKKTLVSFEAKRRRGERSGPPLPLPHHRIYQQLPIFQVVIDLRLAFFHVIYL